MSNKAEFPDNMPGQSSTLLTEAIRDGSNLEMEWLWFASRMTDMHEREYCLKRALYINPRNQATRYELYQIAKCRWRVKKPKHTIEGYYSPAQNEMLKRLRHMMRRIRSQFARLLTRHDNAIG